MAAENFKVKKGLEVGTAITATSSGVNVTGVVTATTFSGAFSGDGSAITGVTASGSGVIVRHDGSNVGTAGTIDFSTNLDVSAISAGIVTITALDTGISSVAADTTPQLGGNLDLDGKFINGTGGANITGVVTATTFVGNGDFVNLDVDGETDLDNVSISGVTTITNSGGLGDFKAIELEKSGTTGASRINFLENGTLRGSLTYSHDNNRVEIISENGESIRFQDKANNQFGLINSSGLTLNGDLDVDGQTDLDDVAIAGVSTFTGAIDANGNLDVDGQTDLDDVVVAGVSTFNDGITLGTNSTTFAAKFADDAVANFGTDNDLQISHDNSNALIRNSTGKIVVVGVVSATSGANITGVVTATTFSGSGASLTNLPSGQLSGALPALDGSALTGVTASGSGIVVKHDGTTVGTAGTVNFSTNLDVTAVSAGIVTVTASGGGATDKIEEGDSSVEVIDTGTGKIDVIADSSYVARFAKENGNRTYMLVGNPVSVSNDYGNNTGHVIAVSNTTTRTATLRVFTSGTGLADDTVTGIIDFASQQSGTGGQTVSKIESSLRGGVENKSDLIFSTSNGGSPAEAFRISHHGGAKVVGVMTATSFHGSGIGLTSLDADNLGSGVIPNGRFPATLPAASGANLTSLTAGNISGTIAESQIADEAVTFAKMQHVGTGVFIGRDSSGTGDIETMTATEARTLLNVADGATAGITTTDSNIQVTWTVTASGNNYRLTGPGNDGTENHPDLYLVRGQRYRFIHNATSSHPLQIQTTGGSVYTDGVVYSHTNETRQGNNLDFNVQHDAPAHLTYNCTAHPSMEGNIYIVGQHLANGANNRVLTATSAYGMNGEANLTYDGTTLDLNGTANILKSDTSGFHVLIRNTNNTNGNQAELRFQGTNSSNGAYTTARIIATNLDNYNQYSDLRFFTHSLGSTTEKLRINSTGTLIIGGHEVNALAVHQSTSRGVNITQSGRVYCKTDDHWDLNHVGTGEIIRFRKGNDSNTTQTHVGDIEILSSGVRYDEAASDSRLKKNIETWTDEVLPHFKTLQPKKFNFNWESDSDTKTKGYMAQDVTSAFPEAFHLGKIDIGETDSNGDSVDSDRYKFSPGKMVPYLMKALQEEIVKREALEARISALEGS